MKEIKISQGLSTLVDDEDYDYLNQWKWFAQKGGRTIRVMRRGYGPHATRKAVMMHRLIMNAPDGLWVDHIDHNALNNQKSNLRLCTAAENAHNSRKQIIGRAKYKGVSYCIQTHRWQSRIKINNKLIFLGRYDTQEKAAEVYNNAALRYFGEFANLNRIPLSNNKLN